MKQYFLKYGLGGGFGYEYTVEEFKDEEQAQKEAWSLASQEYESIAGEYGIRSIEEIMEEEDMDYEDAEMVFFDERESWIDYSVELYDPEKHDDYLI